MGRVINTESAGKDRNRLSRSVVLAIRELAKQNTIDDQSRDLAAFIALALLEIARTIDESVQAWEKRGYWVKAERFRMEWDWTERLGHAMEEALRKDDWGGVAQDAAQVAQKLNTVKVTEHNRLGKPWVGAWQGFSKNHRSS
ncbi:MAG: hypothetical protein M1281_18245 [Chloroflexi bacterium]|nr:hypothetical protein [Chloroflexota bacterium]